MDGRELQQILARIKATTQGGAATEPLNFALLFWSKQDGTFIECEDQRLVKPVSIMPLMDPRGSPRYRVYSENRGINIFSSDFGWQISGGVQSRDNVSGEYFLRMPVDNFPGMVEARLYSANRMSFRSLRESELRELVAV